MFDLSCRFINHTSYQSLSQVSLSSALYWWENFQPNFSPLVFPWQKRRTGKIKRTGRLRRLKPLYYLAQNFEVWSISSGLVQSFVNSDVWEVGGISVITAFQMVAYQFPPDSRFLEAKVGCAIVAGVFGCISFPFQLISYNNIVHGTATPWFSTTSGRLERQL